MRLLMKETQSCSELRISNCTTQAQARARVTDNVREVRERLETQKALQKDTGRLRNEGRDVHDAEVEMPSV